MPPRRSSHPMESPKDRDARIKRMYGVSEKELVDKMNMARDDQFWYYDNLEKLRKKYLDHWIAIRRKKVILVDKDRDRLIKELRARSGGFVDSRVFFITERDIPRV